MICQLSARACTDGQVRSAQPSGARGTSRSWGLCDVEVMVMFNEGAREAPRWDESHGERCPPRDRSHPDDAARARRSGWRHLVDAVLDSHRRKEPRLSRLPRDLAGAASDHYRAVLREPETSVRVPSVLRHGGKSSTPLGPELKSVREDAAPASRLNHVVHHPDCCTMPSGQSAFNGVAPIARAVLVSHCLLIGVGYAGVVLVDTGNRVISTCATRAGSARSSALRWRSTRRRRICQLPQIEALGFRRYRAMVRLRTSTSITRVGCRTSRRSCPRTRRRGCRLGARDVYGEGVAIGRRTSRTDQRGRPTTHSASPGKGCPLQRQLDGLPPELLALARYAIREAMR